MGALRAVSLFTLACAALLCLAGCSDEAGNRREISGSVTLSGQPLDHGSIEFTPLETTGTVDTKSGGPITAGKYSIPRLQGLVPGKYLVRITSGTETAPLKPGELPGPSGAQSQERIPAEYNANSTQEVTVNSSGPNTFDFSVP